MLDMDQGVVILRAVARGRYISGAYIDTGPLVAKLDVTAVRIEDRSCRPFRLSVVQS